MLLGRQVMKGEKGITIIAPAPYKKMKEKEVLDENQRPIMGTDGKPKTEQVEVTVPHFKAVTVFDIAQTSGEPIQTLALELLTAAVQDFDSFMQTSQKITMCALPLAWIHRITVFLILQVGAAAGK